MNYCLLLTLGLTALASASPVIHLSGDPYRVHGEYNVVLNPIESSKLAKQHYVDSAIKKIQALSEDLHVVKKFIFNKLAVLIVHCKDEATVLRLHEVPAVKDVYAELKQPAIDQGCEAQDSGENLWGLSRIGSRSLPDFASGRYSYLNNDGAGTYLYLTDSGIFIQHEDFGGRAVRGYTVADLEASEGSEDLNSHGTHCAGTVMSNTYGVAKAANAIAVKIIDQEGFFTTTNFLEGVNWIFDDFTNKISTLGDSYMAVGSMSLGGGPNSLYDNAVQELIDAGLQVVVSARNFNSDACNYSPARLPDAVTTGATDINDVLASFSNYGPCVDIMAPGVSIRSTSTASTTASSLKSGTSMAVPHVAGLILRYQSQLGRRPPPAEIRAWLTSMATRDVLDLRGQTNTVNLLAYAPCELNVYKKPVAAALNETTIRPSTQSSHYPSHQPSHHPTHHSSPYPTSQTIQPSQYPSDNPSTPPSPTPGFRPPEGEWKAMKSQILLTYTLLIASLVLLSVLLLGALVCCCICNDCCSGCCSASGGPIDKKYLI